jgi:hypothetical protein
VAIVARFFMHGSFIHSLYPNIHTCAGENPVSRKQPMKGQNYDMTQHNAVYDWLFSAHRFFFCTGRDVTRFQPRFPQLCPAGRLGEQPTRRGNFVPRRPTSLLKTRAICPQRPAVSPQLISKHACPAHLDNGSN